MYIDCQNQKKSTALIVGAINTMLASEYLYP